MEKKRATKSQDGSVLDQLLEPANKTLHLLRRAPQTIPSLPLGIVDLFTITGTQVTGPVTSWQTPDGPYTVEHLAAGVTVTTY